MTVSKGVIIVRSGSSPVANGPRTVPTESSKTPPGMGAEDTAVEMSCAVPRGPVVGMLWAESPGREQEFPKLHCKWTADKRQPEPRKWAGSVSADEP